MMAWWSEADAGGTGMSQTTRFLLFMAYSALMVILGIISPFAFWFWKK